MTTSEAAFHLLNMQKHVERQAELCEFHAKKKRAGAGWAFQAEHYRAEAKAIDLAMSALPQSH